jgi:hypothetical protein
MLDHLRIFQKQIKLFLSLRKSFQITRPGRIVQTSKRLYTKPCQK